MLKPARQLSFSAFHLYVFLAHTVDAKGFSSNGCQLQLLNDPSNTTYLLPGATADYVALPYESCLKFCGDETGQFQNVLSRLDTWPLPVLLLLVNATYPSADGPDLQNRRDHQRKSSVFFTHPATRRIRNVSALLVKMLRKMWKKTVVISEALAHILGDPVNYICTLVAQVETWEQCLELAADTRIPAERILSVTELSQNQNMAIILSTFERILDHFKDRGLAERYFKSITETLRNPKRRLVNGKLVDGKMVAKDWADAFKYEAKIARNLVIVRTRHLAPAIFAIGFFIWLIIGALVPVIGGPNSSGGRVAIALTLSWIIFIVLFGNTIGEVSSHTVYADTIKKYLESRPLNLGQSEEPIDNSDAADINEAIEACFGTSYYIGYCYSLAQQSHQHKRHKRHSPSILRAIGHAPVATAIICALAVTSLPPTFFSVRHAFFFSVGLMYHIISPALTFWLRRGCGSQAMRAIRWKNALIAIFMIVIFISNGFGIFFNNCRGWNTIYPRGRGVVIYSKRDYDRNNNKIFPAVMAICMGIQILLCIFVSWIYSKGFAVMKLVDLS